MVCQVYSGNCRYTETDHPQEVLLQDMPTISHNYTKDLITSGYLHEFAYLCFRKFNLRTK